MALYFAYGSNMDAKQMADRCSGAAFAGTAILPGYQFIINQRGYATLRPSAEHETPGVLWELNAEHEAALDSYEGFAYGLYDKCFREVNAGGVRFRALVYIDHRNQRPGPPQAGYLERIIAGAVEHRLPEWHRAVLDAWPRKGAVAGDNV